jgi:hypothetical protein
VFAVEDSDEGGGVRTISSLPPLSCAFVLPSETSPIIAHIVPNQHARPGCQRPPSYQPSTTVALQSTAVSTTIDSFMWQ